MPIRFDDSNPHNVCITLTGHVDARDYDENNARLVARMQLAHRERVKFGILVDGRDSTPPGAKERQGMGRFMEDNAALMSATVYGQVIVLSNALQRGVLTAILWIRPFPMPHYVTGSPEDGVAWLEAQRRGLAA